MRELLDQEHADPGGGNGLEGGRQPLHDDGRKTERQLVDEDEARVGDERLCEHDHLLLAAGEQPAGDLPALLELGEQLERLRDPALRIALGERVGRHAEVVLDGEPGEQAPAFGDDRDAGATHLLGPPAREVVVAQQDAAAGDPEHPADGEHERRLAGSVRAQERRDLAGGDRERHVVQHPPSAT